MNLSTKNYKLFLSLYPPYLGAGIKIEKISDDWKNLEISLTKYWYNRNAVGTHFGGSIYSMTDPHIMLMLMNILGKNYIIWDVEANIKYIKAVKNKITAYIKITNEDLNNILIGTESGNKHISEFTIEIKNSDNVLVALVLKKIYIKKKSNN